MLIDGYVLIFSEYQSRIIHIVIFTTLHDEKFKLERLRYKFETILQIIALGCKQ